MFLVLGLVICAYAENFISKGSKNRVQMELNVPDHIFSKDDTLDLADMYHHAFLLQGTLLENGVPLDVLAGMRHTPKKDVSVDIGSGLLETEVMATRPAPQEGDHSDGDLTSALANYGQSAEAVQVQEQLPDPPSADELKYSVESSLRHVTATSDKIKGMIAEGGGPDAIYELVAEKEHHLQSYLQTFKDQEDIRARLIHLDNVARETQAEAMKHFYQFAMDPKEMTEFAEAHQKFEEWAKDDTEQEQSQRALTNLVFERAAIMKAMEECDTKLKEKFREARKHTETMIGRSQAALENLNSYRAITSVMPDSYARSE